MKAIYPNTTFYYNSANKSHSENGPAIELVGKYRWALEGIWFSEEYPAALAKYKERQKNVKSF